MSKRWFATAFANSRRSLVVIWPCALAAAPAAAPARAASRLAYSSAWAASMLASVCRSTERLLLTCSTAE